jgi:xeroderma pigmentosum group C-complementing protein
MAPGRATARGRSAQAKGKGMAPAEDLKDDGVPHIYKEMLQEEHMSSDVVPQYTSSKRRRVGERVVKFELPQEQPSALPKEEEDEKDADNAIPTSRPQTQTIEDYDQDSGDEDFEWEEVDTIGIADLESMAPDMQEPTEEPLSITINDQASPTKSTKRRVKKPITATEKRIRLDVHKTHLLCLLFHAYQRNYWCNDDTVQRVMRKALHVSPKLVEKLHRVGASTQFQASTWLKECLHELSETWRSMFSITQYGQRRATWEPAVAISSINIESFLDIKDFREKAKSQRGSADYGAQLFCALLRGLGIETRLVCSLQPLPFATLASTTSPARGPSMPTVYALDSDDEQNEEIGVQSSPNTKPRRIARLGRGRRETVPNFGATPSSVAQRARSIPRPRHPIFWVEVFDESYQTWIPVDPIATGKVGRPLSLEPGIGDPQNLLSYVIAFEEDNTARDVTRRYTKAYNAKTRKLRVECTDNGMKWYKKALRLFRRRRKLDRDLLEDTYFTQRDIQEGMPKSIEDFKGHPVYVLERHLYRDEALHPKHEVGKVGQNTKAANLSNLESVYRRQDVHLVKSADKWFRQGRTVKNSEHPLKYVKGRRRRELFDDLEAEVPTAEETVGLYAYFQTDLYVPPPVKSSGMVPRNAYGNLDLYTRSMIPAGTVHVKSRHARQAARVLGVDYVDAVTGFNFKGRHGTAVVNGVVVAAEYKDAMVATLESMEFTQQREVAEAQTARALALWRKFLLGLRIVESVQQYKGADESSDEEDQDEELRQELEREMKHYEDAANREPPVVSLLPEIGAFEVVESIHKLPKSQGEHEELPDDKIDDLFEEIEEGGFMREDDIGDSIIHSVPPLNDEGGRFMKNEDANPQSAASTDDNDGGFVINEKDDLQGYGFFQEIRPKNVEEDRSSFIPHEETADQTKGSNQSADEVATSLGSPMYGVEEQADATHDMASGNDSNKTHQSPKESDNQSLLSHDPEDDEVDPDWLD